MTRGSSVVTATAKVLYWRRITWTNSVGRYLTDRIVIAAVIIIVIFLSLPNMSFRFRTAYTTKKMIRKMIIFAKKNSSKLSRSNRTSDRNWIMIVIVSLAPLANCSAPSIGPADANEENIIVKNVNMPPFLFMLGLDD